MLSIRMRASSQRRKRKDSDPISAAHISGAEGIFDDAERLRVVKEYTERAFNHSRGAADRIVITIEKIREKPLLIPSLAVTTLKSRSSSESEMHMKKILRAIGVSDIAVINALGVVRGCHTMRGAALVFSESGNRVEADHERGVRASRFGISRMAAKALSSRLAGEGINTPAVKEALVLASKVAWCKDVIAELCVSDDPHYTTGYVSSGKYGYVRIPYMKKKGAKSGGRVFFISEDADIASVAEFLERKAVMINSVPQGRGTRSVDEILDHSHR